jgi:hypothetical protein
MMAAIGRAAALDSREHLWDLAATLYAKDSPARGRWVTVRKDMDEVQVEALVRLLRPVAASHPKLGKRSSPKPITSKAIKNVRAMPSFVSRDYFSAMGWSRPEYQTVAAGRAP